MALFQRIVFAAAAVALSQAGALAQSSKVYRVGLVGVGAPDTGILSPGMVRNFTQRGYVDGQTIVFERRAAQGKIDRLPGFIDELLDDRFLIGAAAEIAERLIDLQRRFGVNHLVASVHWPGMPNSLALEQMHILAEEIMPMVRSAN